MAYPENIDIFTQKLNKKQNGDSYVIEECIHVIDGIFDGYLAHDNISVPSIKVYTGPNFSGQEIKNFIISIPEEMPWRRKIKIFSNTSPVYVTYQTPGDTVEADDINILQGSITAIQTELERYKNEGVIDGGHF